MTVWYNDPKEGYAKIGNLVDSEAVNSRLDFSEAVFKLNKSDKTIDCYIYASDVTDIQKSGNREWKFEAQPIYFQLHSESYEKLQGKGKPPVKVDPKPFTQWLFKSISEKCDSDGTFCAKGFISFVEPTNSTTALMVMSGKTHKGTELTQEQIEFFESQCFELTPIEILEKLDPKSLPDLGSKKSYGNSYGGSRGQTEAERLKDRFEFIKQVAGVPEAKTLDDIRLGIIALSGETIADDYLTLLDILLK